MTRALTDSPGPARRLAVESRGAWRADGCWTERGPELQCKLRTSIRPGAAPPTSRNTAISHRGSTACAGEAARSPSAPTQDFFIALGCPATGMRDC